jgi:hypothetical protein
MVEKYEIAADPPESMTREQLQEARVTMCKTITDSFRPGWAMYKYGIDDTQNDYFDEDENDEDEGSEDDDSENESSAESGTDNNKENEQ